jgi:hypothetical protein
MATYWTWFIRTIHMETWSDLTRSDGLKFDSHWAIICILTKESYRKLLWFLVFFLWSWIIIINLPIIKSNLSWLIPACLMIHPILPDSWSTPGRVIHCDLPLPTRAVAPGVATTVAPGFQLDRFRHAFHHRLGVLQGLRRVVVLMRLKGSALLLWPGVLGGWWCESMGSQTCG